MAIDEDGNEYLDETDQTVVLRPMIVVSALLDTVDDKVFTKLGISESDITSARQQTNSWESLDHDLRDEWFEPFENTTSALSFLKLKLSRAIIHIHMR